MNLNVEHRLIQSLASLFQSSKYRTRKRPNFVPIDDYRYRFLNCCCLSCDTNYQFYYCCFYYYYYSKPKVHKQQSIGEDWYPKRNARRIDGVYPPPMIMLLMFLILTLIIDIANIAGQTNRSSLIGAVAAATFETSSNQNCIPICQCKWKNGKETANCDHRSLLSIPSGLSPTTQVIDLTGNVLTQIPPNIFVQRGLINLQRIYLANCHLVDISAESFIKLSNLIELDLSNNTLSTVPARSLAECPGLRRLSLAGNRIGDIKSRSFLPLTNLNWLDLSRNVIYHLDTDAFIGLRSLQVLKLQSNHLQTIPSAQSFVQFLSARVSLELHNNQWRCDCQLKAFRDWIVDNSIPLQIQPICHTPNRLQGRTWHSIPTNQFACPPIIHTVSTHFYKHIGNNVTITCSVSGFPTPKIYWLFESNYGAEFGHKSANGDDEETAETENEKLDDVRYGNKTSVRQDNHNDDIVEEDKDYSTLMDAETDLKQILPSSRYSIVQEREHMGVVASKLSVYSLQPIDTQRITCYSANVGGVVMKNFTLIVSTQEPFSSSRSMDLLVSEFMLIVVAICILLMLLMIFLFVVIFRRKFQHQNSTTGQNHSSGLVLGTNHVGDSSVEQEPNRICIDVMDDDYNRTIMKSTNGSGAATTLIPILNGDIPGNNASVESTNSISSHAKTFIAPYAHNSNLMTSSSKILMVNTMVADMLPNNNSSPNALLSTDPSIISTDLSSQSTTATAASINGNGRQEILSPNSQKNIQNSSDNQGRAPVYYSSTNGAINESNQSIYQQLPIPPSQHCAAISAASVPPDLLSNAYYLTTAASASQFPLLNSGPLFTSDHHLVHTHYNQSAHLIYGTTRIAPTRMAPLPNSNSFGGVAGALLNSKITKVKFADELESSFDSTTSSSSMSAYGTLRRNNNNSGGIIKDHSKPLGMIHRNISSYPEGLRLVESSVDSGEPIRVADQLDETEEDNYYQQEQQQQQH